LNAPVEKQNVKDKSDPVSRLKAGQIMLLPDNPAPYLTNWLFEIGPVEGDGPISWQAMAAWEGVSGIELDPWEARTIRRLSAEYLTEYHKAKKPERVAPYGEIVAARDCVADQFKAMIGAFRK
jgi:hypothetical protein